MNKKYFEQDHLQGYYCNDDEIKIFSGCSTILDVGCGTGWFCKVLKESYPNSEILGIDINDGRKFKDFDFHIADITKIPFKNEKFDGVACKAVLEHIPNSLSAIKEMNRILKKNGKIFISVPDSKDKNFWDDYTHIRPFTKKSLSTLLADGGFVVEKYWYLSSVPGAGLLMRKFKIRNQKILKIFGRFGLFRTTLNIIAIKEK